MTLRMHRLIARLVIPVTLLPTVWGVWLWTHSQAATLVVFGLVLAGCVAWNKEQDGPATLSVGDTDLALESISRLRGPEVCEQVAFIALNFTEQLIAEINLGPRMVRNPEELAIVWISAANRARKRVKKAREDRGPYRTAGE